MPLAFFPCYREKLKGTQAIFCGISSFVAWPATSNCYYSLSYITWVARTCLYYHMGQINFSPAGRLPGFKSLLFSCKRDERISLINYWLDHPFAMYRGSRIEYIAFDASLCVVYCDCIHFNRFTAKCEFENLWKLLGHCIGNILLSAEKESCSRRVLSHYQKT